MNLVSTVISFRKKNVRTANDTAVRLFFNCLLIVTLLFSADKSEGQTRRSRDVFSQAPRNVIRPIDAAKVALANESYAEAVTLLGEVLVDESREDYFMPTNRRIATKSVRRTAESLIGEMPQRGLDVYELKYGIAAKNGLRRAIEANNDRALQSVSRKYLHTNAGYVATMMLGRNALFKGNYGAATRFFKKIYSSKQARTRLDPETSILYAISLHLSNLTDAAVTVIDQLKNEHPTIRLNVGGKAEVYTIADEDETETWLGRVTQELRNEKPNAKDSVADFDQEWTNYRFDKARSSQGLIGEPLLIPQWTVQLADEDQSDFIRTLSKSSEAKNLAVIPTVNAITLKGTVIMRTPEHVFGVNLESGERVWHYPWDRPLAFGSKTTPKLQSDISPDAKNANLRDDATIQAELRTRLLKDQIYGRLSSNGKSVFFIEKEISVRRFANEFSQSRSRTKPTTNRLIALKVIDESGQRVEGQFSWKIDGADSSNESFADAFFMGPPLLHNGSAYVLYEVPGQIRLAELDEQTGDLRWSQQIARTDNREEYEYKRFREFNVATPIIFNGMLYCPTLTGGLVAVDLADRSLAWGATYDPIDFSYASTNDVWTDNGLIRVGELLLFSPVDSSEFFVVEPDSGGIKLRRERENKLFLAGQYNDQVVIVEKDRITLDNLKGFSARSIPLPDRPTGTGFLAGDFYFLPSSNQQLAIINLKEAKIEKILQTPFQFGNIISSNGRIISHSAETVAAFYQKPYAETLAKSLLKANSNDANGLLIRSQLHWVEQEIDNAISAAASSLRVLSTPSAQNLLTELLRRKSLSNEDIDWDQFTDLERLFTVPRYLEKFLVAKVESDFRQGRIRDSLRSIMKLLQVDHSSKRKKNTNDDLFEIESNLRINTSRLLRTRLNAAIKTLDDEQRSSVISVLLRDLNEILLNGHPREIRTVYDIVADFDFTKKLLPQLAVRLIEKGDSNDFVWLEGQLLSKLRQVKDEKSQVNLDYLTMLRQLYEKRSEKLGKADITNITSYRYSNNVQLIECYRRLLLHPGIDSGEKSRIEASLSRCPKGEKLRFHDGMTRVAIFNDNKDPDLYTEGNEQRTRSRKKFHNRLVDEFWSVEVSEDGLFTLRNQFGYPMYSNNSRARGGPFIDLNYELTDYQLCGSLLILAFGFDHVAVDLSQISGKPNPNYLFDTFGDNLLVGNSNRNVEEAILWRISTYEPSQGDGRNSYGSRRALGGSNSFNFAHEVLVDTNGEELGVATTVSTDGYCIFAYPKLICIDPWTGKTNWERDGLKPGLHVDGNSTGVYTSFNGLNDDKDKKRAEGFYAAYSLTSGQAIRQKQKANFVRGQFYQYGQNILSVLPPNDRDEPVDEEELYSIDLNLQNNNEERFPVNWKLKLPKGSRLAQINEKMFCIYELDGQFNIYDIDSGEVLASQQLIANRDSKSIWAIPDATGFVLFVNEKTPYNAQHGFETNAVCVTGQMYYFDRQTLKPKWQSPVSLDRYLFLLNQPNHSPIWLLQQQVRGRRTAGRYFFVRKSDGAVIRYDSKIPGRSNTSVVKLSQSRQSLLFNHESRWLEIKFTDYPRPVEPPIQTELISPFPQKVADATKLQDDPFGNGIIDDPFRRDEDGLEDWVEKQWKANPMNPKRTLK